MKLGYDSENRLTQCLKSPFFMFEVGLIKKLITVTAHAKRRGNCDDKTSVYPNFNNDYYTYLLYLYTYL